MPPLRSPAPPCARPLSQLPAQPPPPPPRASQTLPQPQAAPRPRPVHDATVRPPPLEQCARWCAVGSPPQQRPPPARVHAPDRSRPLPPLTGRPHVPLPPPLQWLRMPLLAPPRWPHAPMPAPRRWRARGPSAVDPLLAPRPRASPRPPLRRPPRPPRASRSAPRRPSRSHTPPRVRSPRRRSRCSSRLRCARLRRPPPQPPP